MTAAPSCTVWHSRSKLTLGNVLVWFHLSYLCWSEKLWDGVSAPWSLAGGRSISWLAVGVTSSQAGLRALQGLSWDFSMQFCFRGPAAPLGPLLSLQTTHGTADLESFSHPSRKCQTFPPQVALRSRAQGRDNLGGDVGKGDPVLKEPLISSQRFSQGGKFSFFSWKISSN